MDGLEVKVQLGTVWKQSLTELSGGQRYGYSGYHLNLVLMPPDSFGLAIMQISDRTFPYHGTPTVQTSTHVYSRRD